MKKLNTTFSYVRNKHGLRVKVCCASCDKKVFDTLYNRRCQLTGKRVHPSDSCSRWQMSQELENAGREQRSRAK